MSIRLSEKHGVNPALTTCYWCGKETGVALLGKLKNDAEAPRYVFTDYDPCDECKEAWTKGVVVLIANLTPQFTNQPPIQTNPDLYPSAGYVVIKKTAAKQIFGKDFNSPRVFVDQELFDQIMGINKEAGK